MKVKTKHALLFFLCALMAAGLLLGAACLRGSAESGAAPRSVAVHDPSVVLAYEDETGNAYPSPAEGRKKVYYVFGTNLAAAKSYDLKDWESVSLNLHDFAAFYRTLGDVARYSGLTPETLEGNLWAPDVIYNPVMGKWTMYLSVNGAAYNSSIVLLTANSLCGDWKYVGPVVFSGMGFASNDTSLTDFEEVTGKSSVPEKYVVNTRGGKNEGTLLYGLNAIDPCPIFDGDRLYMSYGSWFGGIYLLELDPSTGLRKGKYEDITVFSAGEEIGSGSAYTAYCDEYFGMHIAGGNGVTGEGSYLQKIGDRFYLFLSYGGLEPDGGYNMRVFRSDTVTGYAGNVCSQENFVGYRDAAGRTAMVMDSDVSDRAADGPTGVRLMSGYSWSWWDFAYVAQGHNSAFVDDDGRAYVVYHNKFTDGSKRHVLKVHELFVNADGWLVTAPFERSGADEVATGLSAEQIAGDWGYLYMTRNNGKYASPQRDAYIGLLADGTSGGKLLFSAEGLTGNFAGTQRGTFTYDPDTGECTLRVKSVNHKGYLLWQELEGTGLRTLAFAGVNTDGSVISQYLYWAYRYPDERTAAEYLLGGYALPSAIGDVSLREVVSPLWKGTTLSFERTESELTVSANGKEMERRALTATDALFEYGEADGQRFLPFPADGGLSVSFTYENYRSDWDAVLTGSGFRVGLSVLEMERDGTWGSVFESAATGGGDYTSFYGSGRATVTFFADGSIAFSRDGKLMLRYDKATAFAGELCKKVFAAAEAGTLSASYPMKNVVISASEESAEGETEVYEIGDERFTLSFGKAEPAVNTNTAWWDGAFGETVLREGNRGLKYVYSRSHDNTDNAVQIYAEQAGGWGTFYPFGPLGEFADGWQKNGNVRYYLNGEPADLALDTGIVAPSKQGFWHGDFAITVFRFDGTLRVVCDFTRASDGERITAVYTLGDIAGELTVRLDGFAADLVGTVAQTESIARETLGHTHSWSDWSLNEEGDEERVCSSCGERETRTSGGVTAFRNAVNKAVSAAEGEKREALRAAIGLYGGLTAGEKQKAQEDFAALEAEIEAYNRAAETVNEAMREAAPTGGAAALAATFTACAALAWLFKRGR